MDIIEQLRRDEGVLLYVYDDATGKPICSGDKVIGYPTIGIGRLIDLRKGGGITQEEAEYLLQNDIARRVRELAICLPWINQLDEARHGVLVNMSFQLGTAGLMAFKKTLKYVQDGKYMAAANEMLHSKWAEQTPERAARLAKQMMTGIWQ